MDFKQDLFEIRRTNQVGAGVPYDPESLISGDEEAQGMTYINSHREWPNEESYAMATEGRMTTEEILAFHPRVLNSVEENKGVHHYRPSPWGDEDVYNGIQQLEGC
jgi:hypothetical protein